MSTLTVVEPKFELMTEPEEFKFIMRKLERAGRTCYKSEKAMREDSADDFIKKIIDSGHESVIEHAVITGRCIGSRSMSHQLVRHRIAAYSQESQRYCDYSGDGDEGLRIIVPPSVGKIVPGVYHKPGDASYWHPVEGTGAEIPDGGLVPDKITMYMDSVAASYQAYQDLREHGIKPEDARELLPNATKTEVVTTYNLRTWRHVFRERALNSHAQWQIKKIMREALAIFAEYLPVIFGDLQEQVK